MDTGGASLLCFGIPESGDETWKMVALFDGEEHGAWSDFPVC